jgi:hypothetical protein
MGMAIALEWMEGARGMAGMALGVVVVRGRRIELAFGCFYSGRLGVCI